MATVQDSKSGKFKQGHKGPGRPAGSKNKLRLTDVMADCDKLSTEALEMLVMVMRDEVKGASVSQRMGAAVKILDIAYKNKTELEKTEGTDSAMGELTDEMIPRISLKAI